MPIYTYKQDRSRLGGTGPTSEGLGMSGSRGGQGVRTSQFWDHDTGFLTLGPKLDPLLDPPFLRVNLRRTPPPFKNPGSGLARGLGPPGSAPELYQTFPNSSKKDEIGHNTSHYISW